MFVFIYSTMNGSLDKKIKERKKAERKKADTVAVEASAEDVEQTEESGENEATTTRIANLKRVLSLAEGPVHLLQLLADPDDAVQTIENFFDLSFLVKVSII